MSVATLERVDEPVLALERLTLGYGDRAVLTDVNLTVARGERVALLGANGSGKTTLLRGLLGLAEVLGGRLELLGVRHDRFRERWRLGYVPQRHTISGVIPSTVREVVASGRLARRALLTRRTSADDEAVARALDQVGLSARARDRVGTLSGGQQRRTLIARALAAEPEVLVMDEPTAGVDTQSQQALLRTLHVLAAAGTTMVVATHEPAPFADLFTREVLVREGSVHEGTLPEHPRGAASVREGTGTPLVVAG